MSGSSRMASSSGLNPPFIFAGAVCDPTRDNAGGVSIARIRLCPRFESLQLLLQVPGYLAVVEHQDVAPLPIADAIPKPVGYADFLGAQIGLAHVPRHKPEIGMRHRELRIDGDGLLKMRDRGRQHHARTWRFSPHCTLSELPATTWLPAPAASSALECWPATHPAASSFESQSGSALSGPLLFFPAVPVLPRGPLPSGSSWRAATKRTGCRGLRSSLPEPRNCRFARRSRGRPPA